jgi:hypothetical protein
MELEKRERTGEYNLNVLQRYLLQQIGPGVDPAFNGNKYQESSWG